MNTKICPLEIQRKEFSQRKFLAMPIAGAVMWTIAGIGGIFLPDLRFIAIPFAIVILYLVTILILEKRK